jgi:16S rRNA (adenine(1408)-N(1))-methyltransferase
MEVIQGKQTFQMDALALARRLIGYTQILIDLGTGDGRFVCHMAGARSDQFYFGVDACRENLHTHSRLVQPNALYVIANAQALPRELYGLASHVTINFPWGSLLSGLLAGEPKAALLDGLVAVAQPGATLDVRLNGGALAEAGWSLEDGSERVRQVLSANGFAIKWSMVLDAPDLRACPTTWAKQLAFGRDPRARHLHGKRV